MPELVLLQNVQDGIIRSLETYRASGGLQALQKALSSMTPAQVIDEVKKSGLRGRGGAGFATGMKWGFIPQNSEKPKYLVVNSDESEPGTCKDRVIIEKNPFLLLEGIALASYAIGAHACYIYIRGEYFEQATILSKSIEEGYQARLFGPKVLGFDYGLDVYLHRGAGAYICGEETGLLESLEGRKGWPRLKPPFPAIVGLYGSPTVVNNVETIAAVPAIIEKGGEWYSSIGTLKNSGTRLFGISGHVNRPGVYELPLGVPLRELIFTHAGGIKNGKALKAVIPGGSSCPVLKADEIDVKMDFDSVAAIGSMLGSAGVVAMDETTCMVKVLYRLIRFYAHESCGQCTPCREGTAWAKKILQRIYEGEGRPEDVETLLDISKNMSGTTICPLADAAAMPLGSYIHKFREEFEAHIREKRCQH